MFPFPEEFEPMPVTVLNSIDDHNAAAMACAHAAHAEPAPEQGEDSEVAELHATLISSEPIPPSVHANILDPRECTDALFSTLGTKPLEAIMAALNFMGSSKQFMAKFTDLFLTFHRPHFAASESEIRNMSTPECREHCSRRGLSVATASAFMEEKRRISSRLGNRNKSRVRLYF